MKDKFPNGLQAAMDAKGVGPTELGRLVQESKQNIQRWAAGKRRLTPEAAMKIAPHLSVSATDLVLIPTEEEKPAGPATPPDGAIGYALQRIAELGAEQNHLIEVNRNLAERVSRLEGIVKRLGRKTAQPDQSGTS